MTKINVAIVDDNPLILNTLDELINAEDGLSVIGKAGTMVFRHWTLLRIRSRMLSFWI